VPTTEFDLALALTYYAPYTSGLTDTARVVAEGLARRGRRVAVVCGRHDAALPAVEMVNGVEVHRAKAVATVGKGLLCPSFPARFRSIARRAALVNLHLPLLEAGLLTRLAAPAPVVLTYHCDVSLPPGMLNTAQTRVIDASSRAAIRRAGAVVVTSDDYLRASRVAGAVGDRAVEIPPPCQDRRGGAPTFRETEGMHVGFLGRIVEEKGLEHLVAAFRMLPDPDARLLIGGSFDAVAGGSVIGRVRAAIGDDDRIRLLGFVDDGRLPDFYASLDVFALPSVNAFEAFGIVQVEAMMAGVPSVASDLPGVRTPVGRTGFGRIVSPRDERSLSTALVEAASFGPAQRAAGSAQARELYGAGRTIDAYERLFDRLTTPVQR
jgi:glycosyltransferase involved in cell wall biosynthesis